MTLAILSSCSNEKKVLVLYYSQTGATKTVAEVFGTKLNADVVSIDVEEAYDGTFDETVARCLKEQQDGIVPTLKPIDVNVKDYDVIFLGYPVWFGTYAPPVGALLNEEKFEGKTIVPFCTFGSGGLDTSSNDLKKALPGAVVMEGYGVRNARISSAPAEVERFLIANGYIEGETEAVPDYSEQQPVTEEQAAIFEEACSGYQFPLGTPVSCGLRETPWGTEYLFTAQNASADGQVSQSSIYVTVADGKAEFTQVVR